jgi:hypothetical protein
MWLFIFAAAVYMLRKMLEVPDSRAKRTATVLGWIYSLFLVIGQTFDVKNDFSLIFESRLTLQHASLKFFGMGMAISCLLIFAFEWIMKTDFTQKRIGKKGFWLRDNYKSLFVSTFVIMLCWLPQFLVFFPGLLSFDSFHQIRMTLGMIDYTNHHPFLHTLLIKVFIEAGVALGDIHIGIAMYTLFQMFVMALIVSYVLRYFARIGVCYAWRLLCLLFFALSPLHGAYSITMWKDVLFGGVFFLTFIYLFQFARKPNRFVKSKKNLILLAIMLFLSGVLRNNGFYVVVITAPIMLLIYRRHWKQISAVFLSVFIVLAIYRGPLFDMFEVEPSPPGESLSVPLQQMARTYKFHYDELTESQKLRIQTFLPCDIAGRYSPRISDPIKDVLDKEYYGENKVEFFSLWAELLLSYPGTFIAAFLNNSYGYYYPEINYWQIYSRGDNEQVGVTMQPIPNDEAREWVQRFRYHFFKESPMLSKIYSIGFYCWVVLASAMVLVAKKRKDLMLPFIFAGLLWFTTLASPVYGEFRYLYAICMCSVPSFVVALHAKRKDIVPVPESGESEDDDSAVEGREAVTEDEAADEAADKEENDESTVEERVIAAQEIDSDEWD